MTIDFLAIVNTVLLIGKGLCTSDIIIGCNANAKIPFACSKSITTTTLSLREKFTWFLSEYEKKNQRNILLTESTKLSNIYILPITTIHRLIYNRSWFNGI